MSEKLEELISLLYQDNLTQYGKRLLVENIEKLQKENKELKKNYINVQNNTNMTFHKVVPPPEPQLPIKTLCESFSKKARNKNERGRKGSY